MKRFASPAAAAAALVAAALLLPEAASAQQPLQPVQVVASGNANADALHASARRIDGEYRRYRKAADLHLRSAEMREAGDPQASDCMRRAGLLLYYSGSLGAAQEALAGAGDRAAALGDVLNAANAFVDAAYVAQELRHPSEALALATRAELLASSPLLSATQRTAITSRMQFAGAPRSGVGVTAMRAVPSAGPR